MIRTRSELLFESFCASHALPCERVAEGAAPTPDYIVSGSSGRVYFEIKQIDEDADFSRATGVSSRTVGDHVRGKIVEARPQMQVAAAMDTPSVLLIYNNLDPMQLFGTERHDFIAAMYGELTVVLRSGAIVDSFQGRNSTLRESHNTSFSAVGHLRSSPTGTSIEMYENIFARNRLDPSNVPACFGFLRVEVTASAA